jgi:GDP-4-dehydro-6-deoxy-D-mannose reductase
VTRAVITGGRGFVGRYLAAELEAAGNSVVLLDRVDDFDVTDRAGVHHAFASARPDVVYHLAAFTHVGASWDEPVEVVRVNVEGTCNVLDAAIDAGAQRVLVVGSAEEYGRVTAADMPLREDAPLRPTTPYGASKVAAGFFALQAWLGRGLETIRVRPFNHTGEGQPPQFVAPALAHRIAQAEHDGDDHIVVGNLDPVRELLDVRDVVRSYRLLMEHGAPGAVYNVCRGTGMSIREIAESLVAKARRPLELRVDPALMRPVEVPNLVGDPSAIVAATSWRPEYALDDTLQAVLDGARRQLI